MEYKIEPNRTENSMISSHTCVRLCVPPLAQTVAGSLGFICAPLDQTTEKAIFLKQHQAQMNATTSTQYSLYTLCQLRGSNNVQIIFFSKIQNRISTKR